MTTTITLSQTITGRIAITVGGVQIATTKDGGNLVARADRILAEHRIHRGSGYNATEAGLTATGADLR